MRLLFLFSQLRISFVTEYLFVSYVGLIVLTQVWVCLRANFGFITGFIGYFDTQLMTKIYRSISQTNQSSQSQSLLRCLVTSSNIGRSSASGVTSSQAGGNLSHQPPSLLSYCLWTLYSDSTWSVCRSVKLLQAFGSTTISGFSLLEIDRKSKSKSELLYDWQFTAKQFVLAPSPLRLMIRDFFQLNTCCHSPYVTSSLTRRWICLVWICLAFCEVYISRV
jgi:hypothetical protein